MTVPTMDFIGQLTAVYFDYPLLPDQIVGVREAEHRQELGLLRVELQRDYATLHLLLLQSNGEVLYALRKTAYEGGRVASYLCGGWWD